jgi:hypothetical protein
MRGGVLDGVAHDAYIAGRSRDLACGEREAQNTHMLATAVGSTVAVWDPSPNIPVQLLPRWSVAQSGVARCVRWNHTNQVVGVSGDGALLVRALSNVPITCHVSHTIPYLTHTTRTNAQRRSDVLSAGGRCVGLVAVAASPRVRHMRGLHPGPDGARRDPHNTAGCRA